MPTITGTLGPDTLDGGDGDDVLIGLAGVDTLSGGAGRDRLYAGSVNGQGSGQVHTSPPEMLFGGAGDDTVVWTRDAGPMNVDGGEGFDTLDFGEYISAAFVFTTPLQFRQGATPGTVEMWQSHYIRGGGTFDALYGTVSGIERLVLGDGVRVALPESTQNWVIEMVPFGFGEIVTGTGDDTLSGGTRADIFRPGGGSNVVSGGAGFDTVYLDAAYSASVFNYVSGGVRIQSGTASNLLTGVERIVFSDRTIDLPTAPLSGTDGDDTLVYVADGTMLHDGGAGFDTIDFSARFPYVGGFLSSLQVRLGSVDGTIEAWESVTVRGGTAPDRLVGTYTGYERLLMADVTGVYLANSTRDWTIVGSATGFGNITTGSGNDTITGGATDDWINPGGGSNSVIGGLGDDTVTLNAAYADSIITRSNGVLRIQTGSAVNLLTGIEHIVFTDRTLDFAVDGVTAPAGRRVSASVDGTAAFTATAGADIMIGYVSTDTIDGLAGDDWLYGASGNDVLKGGLGNDYIDGGTHTGVGSPFQSWVDIAVFEGNFADYSLSVANGIWTVSGAASGTDRVVNIETFQFADRSVTVGPNGLVQTGTEGNDTLTGTTAPDELSGLGGDDRLDAGSVPLTNTAPITTVINSNDTLRGGAGNDTLTSQGISNGSILDGGDGDDVISVAWSATSRQQYFSSGTTYTVYTGVAGDPVTLLGGAGSDHIRVYSNAVVDGGSGDDVITVGPGPLGFTSRPIYNAGSANGSVRITGGSGADTFVLSNPVATVVITDFQVGIDKIDLSDSYDFSNNLISPRLILGQQGADTLIMSYDGSKIVARLVGIDAASLGGSTFLDNELGDPILVNFYAPLQAPYIDPSRIYSVGTEGADTLGGATIAMGLGGDDVITAGSASSTLGGGTGNDRLTGSTGPDILRGDDGSDVLVGADGGDRLYGGAGDDRIQGGRGSDVLWGGSDPDTGAGNGADVFVFTSVADSNADGYDIIQDFSAGLDTIDLTAVTISQINIIRNGFDAAFVFATTADGTVQIGSTKAVDGRDLIYTGAHGVNIQAVGSARAYLHGSARGDTITGSSGDDAIWGEAGADVLTGGEGADVFEYELLSDSTAAASDIITDFQTGVDRIFVGSSMGGSVASLTIVRSNGSSFLFATGVTGNLQVGLAGAALNGGDVLAFAVGGSFVGVTMIGSAAADVLVGGTAADIVLGGGGADLLTGGLGADVFRYTARSDSTGAAYDVITDFATGTDRIDLTGLSTTSISVIRSGGSSFIFAQTPTGDFQLIALNQAVNGSDFVYGGTHGVYLIGSADADVLRGTSLADPIAGGAGNDTITGGGGADTLFGDAGADTFVYVAASDSSVAAADTLFGFVSGQDRIDLTGVRTGASDAFGIAYFQGGSFLFVDLGGNGTNDMLIQLADTRLLTSDIRWSPSAGEIEPVSKDGGPDVLPVGWADDGNLTGPMTWTGRYMLDLDTVATAGLHHTPDWYL